MTWNLLYYMLVFSSVTITVGKEAQSASDFYDCMVNDDCSNPDVCCSYTPAFGRREIQGRQLPLDWDGMVHYCLPWKNENSTWCELKMQYSPETDFYSGLCPCGPGLECTPTTELDDQYYPKDRFGKCTPVE